MSKDKSICVRLNEKDYKAINEVSEEYQISYGGLVRGFISKIHDETYRKKLTEKCVEGCNIYVAIREI